MNGRISLSLSSSKVRVNVDFEDGIRCIGEMVSCRSVPQYCLVKSGGRLGLWGRGGPRRKLRDVG